MCRSSMTKTSEGDDDDVQQQLAVIRSSSSNSSQVQQQQQSGGGAIAASEPGTPSVVQESGAVAAASAFRKEVVISGTAATSQVQEQSSRQLRVLGQAALKVRKKQSQQRIRKKKPLRLPLPTIQFKAPVIIHTYSPKIIHTEPEHFMSLVQELTGSSDTRLRLKEYRGTVSVSWVDNENDAHLLASQQEDGGGIAGDGSFERQYDLLSDQLQPELCNHFVQSESSARCSSPASSSSVEEEYHSRFLNSALAKMNMKQCDDLSPKGPLPSYGGHAQEYFDASYEFLNPSIFFSVSAFDQLQPATAINPASVAKRELLSPNDLSSFSDLSFFAGADTGFDAPASTSNNNNNSSTKFTLPQRCQLHHQDATMSFSAAFGACSGGTQPSCIDAGNCYTNLASTPGFNYLSPLEPVPDILPTALTSPTSSAAMQWPSSSFFQECLNISSPSDSALPFSYSSYSPAPGTMISLRDIEATMYVDDLLRGC